MPQLGLVYSGNPFQAGKAERLTIFFQEAGNVIIKLTVNFFEWFAISLIVPFHFSISSLEISNGFFNCFSFPNTTVIQGCIVHIS